MSEPRSQSDDSDSGLRRGQTFEPGLEHERDLLDRVIAGDPRAVDSFVRRYARLVRHTVGRSAPLQSQDADDVTQRVFIKLLDDDCRRLLEWRGPSLEAYLCQIARNEAISFARQNIRPGHDSIDDDTASELPADVLDGEGEALLSEARKWLAHCFEALTPAQQEAVVYRYQDELDQRAIAAMFGITQSNAAQRVFRATQALRECLSSRLGPAPWVLT